MGTRPTSVASRIIILILAIFVSYIIFLNIVYSAYTNALIYLVIIVPVFAVVLFLSAKINILPLPYAIMVFLMAFLIKGVFAFLVNTQPVSDFKMFYDYAVSLAHGNNGLGQSFYFRTWAYQTGPVIYYAAIIKLFGTGLLPLKLVNCFFMAGSNMFIYLIARKVSNDFTARFVALLYLIYPAPYLLTSVLTNQHFAACMFLAAIYVIFNERMNILLRGILAGLLLSLGNAVRPLGLVIIIGAVLWSLIEAIRSKKPAVLVLTALLTAVYLTANLGLSATVRQTGINSEGLENNFPLWKFVVGLNQQSKGLFSYDDQNKIFYIKDFSKRNETAIKTIKERISVEPHKMAAFFGEKISIMWAEYDTLMWEFYVKTDDKLKVPDKIQKIEPIIQKTEKIFYIFIFVLLLFGLVRTLIDQKIRSEILLLSIILLCYLGIHVLIEIQVRYRYFAVMLVFILAAKGSEILFASFKKYKANYLS